MKARAPTPTSPAIPISSRSWALTPQVPFTKSDRRIQVLVSATWPWGCAFADATLRTLLTERAALQGKRRDVLRRTLPEADQDLCTAILNDFVQRYSHYENGL